MNLSTRVMTRRLPAALLGMLVTAGGILCSQKTSAQTSAAWINNTAGASWGTATNWIPNVVPGGAGSIIHFNNDISANTIVTLDGARTVGQLILNDLGGTQTFTLASGTGGGLTFDGGAIGGGNSHINKFQGGFDVISAPVILPANTTLNVRTTVQGQRLTISGPISGAGTITHYGDGTMALTGDNSAATTTTLWLWNRGTNNVNNIPQVVLGATTGNAWGGNIIQGNASYGGTGHSVLQLELGRSNLDQIKDTSIITMQGFNSRWSYFKLMGGNETVGGIVDVNGSAVIENYENEAVTTAATLTIAGSTNSYVQAYIRDFNASNLLQGDSVNTLGEYVANPRALGLTKSGTGTLTLSGTNIIYTGTTTVSGGSLVLIGTTNFRSDIVNNATTVFEVATGATWNFQRVFSSGPAFNLKITGTGAVTKRGNGILTIGSNGNSMGGGLRLEAGTLNLAGSSNTIGGTGVVLAGNMNTARILNLSGGTTITGGINAIGQHNTIGSSINVTANVPVTGAVSLRYLRMNLSGNGVIGTPTSITLAGRPTAGNDFGISLDNSGTANANRIGDTTAIISQGGTFSFTGGTTGTASTLIENVGALTLTSGEFRIASAGIGTLRFASTASTTAMTRAAGSTISFNGGAGTANNQVVFATAPGLANGIIGGWATLVSTTVGGNRFASYGANGVVAATTTTSITPTSWTATSNILATGGNTTIAANTFANSLVIDEATARTITLGSANILAITSGGILTNGQNHVITGGTLTAGPSASGTGVISPGSYEMFVGVSANQLTIASAIRNNGANAVSFTKTGEGLLLLTGANSYTGKTYINNGTLRVIDDNQLGAAPGSVVADQMNLNGGILLFANPLATNTPINTSQGNVTIPATRGFTIGAAGGRIEVGTTNQDLYNVNILGPINATGVLQVAPRGDSISSGSVLTIGSTASTNTFAGGIHAVGGYAGTTRILGNNSIGQIFLENGTLVLPGNNTISGNITNESGTLDLSGTNVFNGKLTLIAGTVKLRSAGGLGSNPLDLDLGIGTLELYGNTHTIGLITGGANSIIRNENDLAIATVIFNQAITQTFAGRIDYGNGVLNLTKTGQGRLVLTNSNSSFFGVVRIEEGALDVSSISYGGVNSALGSGTNEASSIVINGGALTFTPTTVNISDRSFTIGTKGATLSAQGAIRNSRVVLGVDFGGLYVSPDVAFEGTGNRTLTLAGFNTGDNEFNLLLGDSSATGVTSLLKIGSGNWLLGKRNTYSGLTTIQEGTLTVAVDGALGTPTSATTANATANTFTGNLTNGARVSFSASTVPAGLVAGTNYFVVGSTGTTFQVSATRNGAAIDFTSAGSSVTYVSGGAGTSILGGRLELRNVNYSQSENLFFEGGSVFLDVGSQSRWAGDFIVNVNGTITANAGAVLTLDGNLAGNRGITQVGEGTVILRGGVEAITPIESGRRFYSVQAGTLVLDYSINNTSKLVDDSNLNLGGSRRGGIVRLRGGNHVEVAGVTTLQTGANQVIRDSGASILRMGTISRAIGSSIYFDDLTNNDWLNNPAGQLAQVSNTNLNGILGSWAIIRDGINGDIDWARNQTNGVNGPVVPSSSYQNNTWSANVNNNITQSTPAPLASNRSVFTLRYATPVAARVELGGGTNTIGSGGILISPSVGANDSSLVGAGALTVGNQGNVQNLLVHQYNSQGAMIINNRIVDRGVVTKPGATLTVGSDLRRIDVDSTTDLYLGMAVTGTGIPAGATITSIVSATQIQISVAHSANGSSPADLQFLSVTGVEKMGPGLLALGGQSTYTGVTFIANGTLRIGSIANGLVASPLGASSNAAANLVFNGGTLQYVGDNGSSDRSFTVTDFGNFNVGHERTVLSMSGAVSGADTLEKSGTGTLLMTGSAGSITEWRISEGTLKLQLLDTTPGTAGLQQNVFSSSVANLVLSGGNLIVRGSETEGNSSATFGGRLVIAAGTSEVRAVSTFDSAAPTPIGRNVTLVLQGSDDVTTIGRNAGGTARFIADPEAGAGSAIIQINAPISQRGVILPWAVYRSTANVSDPEINQFATIDITTGFLTTADSFLLHNIGDLGSFQNPDNWLITDNPAEGATGPFSGTLTADRQVRTVKYARPGDSLITIPTGTNLRLEDGAILVAFDTRQVGGTSKRIMGAGTISGGLPADDGGRDLILHNYNRANTFEIGASIVNDRSTAENDGSTTTNSNILRLAFTSTNLVTQRLRVGMVVSGPGIPDGTVITAIDTSPYGANGYSIQLSNAATTDNSYQTYSFTDTSNLVQTGIGTTLLTGANQYTGKTFVNGGVLRLGSANAIPGGIGATGGTSAIIVDGGVIGLGIGNFLRPLGTGSDKITFTGSGGFAAYGADRTVNFGGSALPTGITFGQAGFVPDGSSLILGSHDATHKVTVSNPIALGGFSQAVHVNDGPAAVEGELGGIVSGGGQLVKFGVGTLRLSAANTYAGGTEIAEGTVIAANVAGSLGTGQVRLGTSATNTLSDSSVGLDFEGGTFANSLRVGTANTTGYSQVRFLANTTLQGQNLLEKKAIYNVAGGVTTTISGQITGAGGLRLTGSGVLALTGSTNTLGTPATSSAAVNGGLVVRAGTVLASSSGALGTGVIELGDAVPSVLTVDRATTFGSLSLSAGTFDSTHDGLSTNSGGPGAFVGVDTTIDGKVYTTADEGKLILVKDESGNAERNGVYRITFNTLGLPTGTMSLVRADAMNSAGEFLYGTQVSVTTGSSAGKTFYLANTAPSMNNDSVYWLEDVVNPNTSLLVTSNATIANAVDINGGNGTGRATLGADTSVSTGNVTFSGNVVLQDQKAGVRETKDLNLSSYTSAGQGVIFSGILSEASAGAGVTDDVLSLFKVGTGTVTLTQANTYHGPTTVSEGKLLVNNTTGSGTGTGSVSVLSGASLGGTGIIQGNTTVTGGFVLPGDPTVNNGVGTLTFNQQLILGANSEVQFLLTGNSINDRLITQAFQVSTSTIFRVELGLGYTPTAGHTFNLIDWTSLVGGGDTDWVNNLVLPPSFNWDTTLFNSQGIISIVLVPEPGRILLIGLAAGAAFLRRRRRI